MTISRTFVERYLNWEDDFVAAVQEGKDAAARGDFAFEEEVDRVFNKYRPPE